MTPGSLDDVALIVSELATTQAFAADECQWLWSSDDQKSRQEQARSQPYVWGTERRVEEGKRSRNGCNLQPFLPNQPIYSVQSLQSAKKTGCHVATEVFLVDNAAVICSAKGFVTSYNASTCPCLLLQSV